MVVLVGVIAPTVAVDVTGAGVRVAVGGEVCVTSGVNVLVGVNAIASVRRAWTVSYAWLALKVGVACSRFGMLQADKIMTAVKIISTAIKVLLIEFLFILLSNYDQASGCQETVSLTSTKQPSKRVRVINVPFL